MSRIYDLVAEYCANGVVFRTLAEVTSPVSKVRWENVTDELRYVDLTSIDRVTHKIGDAVRIDSDSAPDRAQQLIRSGDVLFGTTRPMLKRYSLVPPEYDGQVCSTGICVLRPKPNVQLPKFLFHLLGTPDFYKHIEANQQGTGYPAVSDRRVKQHRVPVPPLEVQREIVRILDHFTELKAELEAELEAELDARRRQYAHHRNILLTFSHESVQWLTLGELAVIGTGSRNTNEAVEGGAYPFYVRSQDPLASDKFEFDETAIVTAGDGSVGKVFHFVTGRYALHQRAYRIVPATTAIDPRFLFHFIRHDFARYLSTIAHHATVSSLRRPMFLRYPVPVPPRVEQRRITETLDKFDALVNDLSIGLRAELTARRKQYEYYRDRLLTFKEAA